MIPDDDDDDNDDDAAEAEGMEDTEDENEPDDGSLPDEGGESEPEENDNEVEPEPQEPDAKKIKRPAAVGRTPSDVSGNFYGYDDEQKTAWMAAREKPGEKVAATKIVVYLTDKIHNPVLALWETTDDEGNIDSHTHDIPSLSVVQHMQIYNVSWETAKSPWFAKTFEQDGAKRSAEIHKKCDKKTGDNLLLFKVLDPDEPRGQQQKSQVASVLCNNCLPSVRHPDIADEKERELVVSFHKRAMSWQVRPCL